MYIRKSWTGISTLLTRLKMPPVHDIQDLRDRITAGCETIRCTPGIFERVRESMRRRVTACIQKNGEHFQHLL